MRALLLVSVLALLLGGWLAAGEEGNLIRDPGFEGGEPATVGWGNLWTRTPDAGEAGLDRDNPRSGEACLRVTYRAGDDWSFGQAERLPAEPGDVYEISGWVRVREVTGAVAISVIPYDAEGKVITWFWGTLKTGGSHEWEELRRRFVVPANGAALTFRLTGSGPGTAWFDDLSLRKVGSLRMLRQGFDETTTKSLGNESVTATITPATGAFSLADKRTGQAYRPIEAPTDFVGVSLEEGERWLTVAGWREETGQPVTLRWEVGSLPGGPGPSPGVAPSPLGGSGEGAPAGQERPSLPEVILTITGEGEFGSDWAFPPAFATAAGQWLVVPLNEGILYPVTDEKVKPLTLVGYSGHGLSMAWFGVTLGGAVTAKPEEASPGLMALVETPDDMALRIDRLGGNLLVEQPVWQGKKGRWFYPRRLRYVLVDGGGYVAQAKRYREYARSAGLLVTLRDKAARNPNVERLIGAVNVWTWEEDKSARIERLKALGIDKVLFSNARTAGEIDLANRSGYLSSRYDNYQDVYPPGRPASANHEGWPQDLVLDARGDWVRGWEIRSKQGNFPGGIVCSPRALERARQHIAEELRQKPYLARFLDTTTASAFRECYNPDHPVTRTEDKEYRMELLGFVSRELNLVTGSETGIDCAVPYVHYFEGMLSLGPYRIADAGRNMMEVAEPTDDVRTFQVGPSYRAPLWELVYHDCVVSTWYWGDYNNKMPAVWERRDLWNLLYATPPMWLFDEKTWAENEQRFLLSYRTISPVLRQVGSAEMLGHEFLTADHTVQRTRFADGTAVTVNFGDRPYREPGGTLAPLGFRVEKR